MIIKTNDDTPISQSEPKENNIADFHDLVKLDRNNLICIASRPGMGKTSLALHMALEYAKKSGKTVYIFSLEMTAEQVYKRMIGYMAEVDSYSLHNKEFSEGQLRRMDEAVETLKSLPIIIDDDSVLSVKDIEKRIEKVNDLGMIVIDYLQLMTSESKFQNRTQEIQEISRELKGLTRKMGIPMMVTSQLWRGVEYRKNKRPTLYDLVKTCDDFEGDADTVIFLYRDEYYHDISKDCGRAEIIIAKNRYESRGTVLLEWHGRYMKFSELAKK